MIRWARHRTFVQAMAQKTTRIEARLSPRQRDQIERAAVLAMRALEFVAAAVERPEVSSSRHPRPPSPPTTSTSCWRRSINLIRPPGSGRHSAERDAADASTSRDARGGAAQRRTRSRRVQLREFRARQVADRACPVGPQSRNPHLCACGPARGERAWILRDRSSPGSPRRSRRALRQGDAADRPGNPAREARPRPGVAGLRTRIGAPRASSADDRHRRSVGREGSWSSSTQSTTRRFASTASMASPRYPTTIVGSSTSSAPLPGSWISSGRNRPGRKTAEPPFGGGSAVPARSRTSQLRCCRP